jgi:type IV pilus biogenesis protein PilP
MSNSKKQMVLLAALLSCSTVFADTTSDQLTKIEAETLLLKAREKQLDVQASILAKQNEIAAKQTVGTGLTQATAALATDPVVRGVEGIGDAVFVTLQLGDGSLVDVQAGDVLSNGMRIVSVAPSSVIVQKGKKHTRLATYVPRPPAFNPSLPAPGLNLPLPVASPRGGVK